MDKRQKFTVTDGELVLDLYVAEEGGYVVRGTFDPALITEADTVEEAFENARDAAATLAAARRKREQEPQHAAASA